MRWFPAALAAAAVAWLLPCGAHAADELVAQRIAKDVYAFVGKPEAVSAVNRGFVANSGFIVGTTGVVVVDTGTSYRHGRRMLDAIARVTDRPIELVINTHAVQEFIFGNAAFEERGIPILAHGATVDLMRARCGQCLERLGPLLGDELRGTSLVLPRRQVTASTTIEAGGRRLELLHFGWASTPGDIAVLEPASRSLFAGGLVSAGRIPEIRDCDFEGWLRALDELQRLRPAHVIPGYGPPSGPQAIGMAGGYLTALDRMVRGLYARSSSLLEALDQADLPRFEGWPLYGALHRQNALHRYVQLETYDLGGDPRSVFLPER